MNLKMQWNKHIKSFLNIDLSQTPYIYVLIFSFILSRVPLLNLGFGIDADGWSVANSAFELRHSHIYYPSRFPGYPVTEYFNSLIIDQGWLATNTLTMLLSLISVIFFAKVLKNLNVANKGLLVLTYAFFPILWINSTNIMDYMWALTFIIIAWFFILEKKFTVAGVIMGLAVGSRITSIILILPFIYLIWNENKRIKDIIYFITAMVIISFILFLPLFIQYGLKFLTYYSSSMTIRTWFLMAMRNGIGLIGRLPALFGFIMLLLSLKVLLKKVIEKDKNTLFLVSAILLIFIIFLKAPYEPEYLIPTIPFGLLLLNKICRKELFVIFCALLLLNSFVSFPIMERNNKGIYEFSAPINDGLIKNDIDNRNEQMGSVQKLMSANINHSVVIIGDDLPILFYLDENVSYSKSAKTMKNSSSNKIWNFEKDILYEYLISLDELQDFQSRGYACYYINGIDKYTKDRYNYDLNQYNCMYINVENNRSITFW